MRPTPSLLSALLLLTACQAPSSPAPTSTRLTGEEILALGAANDFLTAWQNRDTAAALPLLTPALRARYAPDDLANAIAGPSNPHHAAYRITALRRLAPDRLAVDVLLYTAYTNFPEPQSPPIQTLELVQASHEQWLVDRLP